MAIVQIFSREQFLDKRGKLPADQTCLFLSQLMGSAIGCHDAVDCLHFLTPAEASSQGANSKFVPTCRLPRQKMAALPEENGSAAASRDRLARDAELLLYLDILSFLVLAFGEPSFDMSFFMLSLPMPVVLFIEPLSMEPLSMVPLVMPGLVMLSLCGWGPVP